MKRLFGTDGIRGVAGEAPLDEAGARRFGAALAQVVGDLEGHPCRAVLGRDTRESGPWLRDAVAAGVTDSGGSAIDAGVITTPGLAHVLRTDGFDAAVMISASHNPFRDNGLKAFGASGHKLSDELERTVEEHIADPKNSRTDRGPAGDCPADSGLTQSYVDHLEQVLDDGRRLEGLSLAIDCANGSAAGIAPDVFRHYGAEVHATGDAPNGRNINLDCGSLHLDRLAQLVRDRGCSLGLAFDGDADRCLAVDRQGRPVDGDHILYIVGTRLKRAGRLRGEAIVATIMSNLWLEQRLAQQGIGLQRTAVGDKYVLERMLEQDLVLGGEQSGHVIFRDQASTGDGVLTGLLLLDALLDGRQPLDSILDEIVRYPQEQRSIAVRTKPDMAQHPRIGPAVLKIERELDGSGRVVLRYSGTEPVARVMVEGLDASAVRRHAEALARVIEEELGP